MEYGAIVHRLTPNPEAGAVAGAVQFTIAGHRIGRPVPLDRLGQTVWMPGDPILCDCDGLVVAEFIPSGESSLLPSTSAEGRMISSLPARGIDDQ